MHSLQYLKDRQTKQNLESNTQTDGQQIIFNYLDLALKQAFTYSIVQYLYD